MCSLDFEPWNFRIPSALTHRPCLLKPTPKVQVEKIARDIVLFCHSASSWIFFSAFWSNPLYPYCLIAVTRFTPTHSWPVEIFCPGPRLESCPNSHEKLPSLGTGQTTTIAAIINNSNLNQITQSNSQTISLRKHLQFAFDA